MMNYIRKVQWHCIAHMNIMPKEYALVDGIAVRSNRSINHKFLIQTMIYYKHWQGIPNWWRYRRICARSPNTSHTYLSNILINIIKNDVRTLWLNLSKEKSCMCVSKVEPEHWCNKNSFFFTTYSIFLTMNTLISFMIFFFSKF